MNRVIVTRAEADADRLFARLTEGGYAATKLPLMAIAPEPIPPQVHAAVAQFSVFLFTSVNAVTYGASEFHARLKEAGVRSIAIGRKTRDSLRLQGIVADSPGREDSEGILDLLRTRDVSDGVVIVKGTGGRDLLASTLARQGLRVLEVNCYRRLWPDISAEDIKHALDSPDERLIHVASGETLQRLDALCGQHNLNVKTRHTVVIPSERVENEARALGWQSRIVSDGAGDEALLAVLSKTHQTGVK